MYHLNEYRTCQSYGGPEEGGWWFETGEFVQCHGIFASQETASDSRDKVESGGEVDLRNPIFVEPDPGADYPQERPYYC